MTKDKIREGLAWEMALKNGAVAEGQLEWRESTRFFWLHQAVFNISTPGAVC